MIALIWKNVNPYRREEHAIHKRPSRPRSSGHRPSPRSEAPHPKAFPLGGRWQPEGLTDEGYTAAGVP